LKRAIVLQRQISFSSIVLRRQHPEMKIVSKEFHIREGGTS
jgi:hypothetical protein